LEQLINSWKSKAFFDTLLMTTDENFTCEADKVGELPVKHSPPWPAYQ